MITELYLENIGSYEKATIKFAPGKNIIQGENGSGKSTIIKSIIFGFFGDFNLVPNVEPFELVRIGSSSGTIKLKFIPPSRAEEYEVVRNLTVSKRGGKYSVSQNATLRQGNTKVVASGVDEVRAAVEQLLGADRRIFVNTVIGTQGSIADIIRKETSQKVFDQIFGIKDYETAWVEFKDVIKELELELESNNKLINQLESEVKDAGSIEEEIKKLSEWNKRLESDLIKLETDLNSITISESEIDSKITEIENKLASINESRTRINTTIKTLTQNKSKLAAERCPLCEQVLTESYRSSIMASIDSTLASLNAELKAYEREIGDLMNKKDSLQVKKRDYKSKKEECIRLAAETKANIVKNKELVQLYSSRANENAEIQKKIVHHKSISKSLEDSINLAKLIRESYRAVKPILRQGRIQHIQDSAKHLFSDLFGNEYDIAINPENYTLTVIENGYNRAVRTFSGGEGLNLGLAIRLAIVKSVGKQDILILDEPTECLDSYRQELLIEFLDELKTDIQLIIVSHSNALISVADNPISVRKINNISTIS